MTESEERIAVRRGAEHVRVAGATEELGEIVAAPVVTEDQRVTVQPDRDDERDDEDEPPR